MLDGASAVVDKANRLFVVGDGLTEAGVKLLGAQLANMSIGDIEAMLQTNKIDPLVIMDLMNDFIELAKALVRKYDSSGMHISSNNIMFITRYERLYVL
mgnify:CR=1 FL=1